MYNILCITYNILYTLVHKRVNNFSIRHNHLNEHTHMEHTTSQATCHSTALLT